MKKRIVSMALVLAMLMAMLPMGVLSADAASYSGTCGDDMTWELDTGTGVLTISGVDYMDNFTADDEAWDYYRDYIKTVIITDGVTSIGGYAFDNCVNLTSVEIPESVETIEGYAFRNCVNLCSVEIPKGVETISAHAFNNCVNLTSVEIPEGVETIWGYAFYNCVNLTSVTIPDSVTTIGASAFEDCGSLTSVEIPADVYTIGSGAFAWCSSLVSVTIRCERVGSYMFFGCENLTSVELSDDVTTIRGYAFGSCTGLTSITIPGSVTSIDDYAFSRATSLRHIHFLGDTPTIGSKAFDSCSSDLKLCYMEGTEGWENCTYATEPWDYTQSENCTSITYTCNDCGGSYTKKFDPPKHNCLSAVDNGDGTHTGTCSCGEAITEEHRFVKGSCICGVVGGSCGDNVNWSFNTSTGVLVVYGKGDMKNQIAYETDWYSYQYDIKTVIIKDGVTRIGDYAFFNCYSLKSVTIPDSVTGIGNYAFYNCDSLKSVTIPDSVTSIGDDAFCACDNLTSVTIPDSVTSIGNYAFYGCNSLTSVDIPDSVTSIGNEAFFYCENLTGIWVSSENEYYSSDDSGVLFNKDKTTLLQATRRYGAYVIPNSVTKIGPRAFFECNFTSITIPDSVTTISDEAFSHCAKLSSVTIGDGVTSIGSNAFSYCDSLTSIEIPDSVTSMGNFAFRGCYRLTSVELSDSLTIIGNYAFDSCRITSITIPAGVTGIYDYAFANCSYLRHVHFLGDMPTILRFEAFYACPLDLKLCYMEGTKGWENCTYTAEPWDYTATEHCPNVTYTCNDCGGSYTKKLDPPKHSCLNAVDNGEGTHSGTCSCGMAITEEHNFANGSCSCGVVGGSCGDNVNWSFNTSTGVLVIYGKGDMKNYIAYETDWFSYRYDIKTVIIKDGVTRIGDYAFFSCDSLKSVTIPDSVTSIEEGAFSNCTSLTSVKVPDSVTTIGNYAFDGCNNLTSVEIPDSVTIIGDYAFSSCYTLTSIELPAGVTGIGTYTFAYCGNLTSIAIPDGVTSIDEGAFCGCSSLTSIEIPDNVTSIGAEAFVRCDSLTGIWVSSENEYYSSDDSGVLFNKDKTTLVQAPGAYTGAYVIPDSVTSIGDYAFSSCHSLTSIEIPAGVTGIGAYTFAYCGKLTSIAIPDSITSIGDSAFRFCSGLTSIAIPDSVTSIDDYAFSRATSLRHVHFLGDMPVIGSSAFSYCASDLKLCYMEGTKGWENCTYATEPWDYTATEHCPNITYTCNDCGGSYTVKSDSPNHSCLNAVDNGDGTHSGTCSCGEAITEEHRFVNGSCICGAVEITQPILDASLTFGAQLYLENDLTMAFRVKQDKLAAYDISTAYLVVERDIYETGAAQATVETMTINEYKVENGRLIFSYPGIAAAQMNDAIRVTLYIKDAKGQEYVSPVLNTSVATYLDGLLTASASDAKLVTLVMDMVNYGAAAQVYFDRHADAPVNEAFESFKTYASYASADFKTALENLSATENAEGKSGKLNLSLDLGTRIGIQYKVTVPSNVDVEDVTVVVTDANGNVLETLKVAGNATDSRGRYLVNFYGSTSRDMRRVVYATAYAKGEAITGTYAYSISSYAWGVQENAGTQPADLVNVTRAMLLYGDSAAAYFG